MKTLSHPRSLALTLLLGSLALSGCSSLNNVSVSDPAADTLVNSISAQGKVLGGHAAVVGSHVYLLQSSNSGTGMQATSLLEPATSGAVMNGTTDPSLPSTWYYVTTDSAGAFNFSTSAACTSGLALYLYAYGGTSLATTNTTATNNPAIVNLATLGSCGSITSLPYIYLNEVSTVATAYALQGFTKPATSTTANNNATFIGSSNSVQGVKGITNAAATAGELYSIDGHFTSSVSDGEGHIANPSTLNGNGIVPQATIDTLANILAGCVDSSNTSTTKNSACYNLFALATNTGTACTITAPSTTPTCPTGTYAPVDTATAMINIARHPAGLASPTFVSTIFGLQSGTVPYVPDLLPSAQPNDFTLAIQYKAAANVNSNGTNYLDGVESVEVDGNGYVWFTAQTNNAAFQWTSQGVLNSNINSNGYDYGYVSIDGNNNAWSGSAFDAAGIEEFNSNGQQTAIYDEGATSSTGEFQGAYTLVTDKGGDVYFTAFSDPLPTNTNGNQDLFTLTAADQANGVTTQPQYYSITTSNFGNGNEINHGSIDASNDIWLTAESTRNISRVSTTGVLASGCDTVVSSVATTYDFLGIQIGNPATTSNTTTRSCFPIVTPAVSAGSSAEFPAINASGAAAIPIQTTASAGTGSTSGSTPGVYVVSADGSAIAALYSGTSGSAAVSGGTTTSTSSACSGNCNRNGTGAGGGFGNYTITATTTSVTTTRITPVYTGANFYQSFGAAVDGNNNIWITNRAGAPKSSLIELNGTTYSAISPVTTNYIPSNGTGAAAIMNGALNLAIDPSGNIWVTDYNGNQVVEVVGAAAPVVTPLSVAAGNSAFGATP